MHNFETLAVDLVPFFQKSGDCGDTGDSSRNQLNSYDFGVTTRCSRVSPVGLQVVTGPKSSGDAKSKPSQPVNKGVTTVTSVTTSFEEGAASALPAEWQTIWKELKRSEPPSWTSAGRWREMVADAESFLANWGETAGRFAWTAFDLFGVHPISPAARFDVMGLIPILRGRKVSALAERTATIDCNFGAKQTFNRPIGAGAVLMAGGTSS